MKADTVEEMLRSEFDRSIRFAKSPTGFSNAELTLDYLRHFNRYSFERSATFKRLSCEFFEWFGYSKDISIEELRGIAENEREPEIISGFQCLRRPDEISEEESIRKHPRRGRRSEPGNAPIFRLLIIDGFSGHCGMEVQDYALAFDIRIVPLPPHGTHLMQPLDLCAFSPLKASHQKILQAYVRDGHLNFNRVDFIREITGIYEKGLSTHNLMSGFERAGLYPIDRDVILGQLKRKQRRDPKPAIPSLMPDEQLPITAKAAMPSIKKRFQLFSSPTRRALPAIETTIEKYILLDRARQQDLLAAERRKAKTNDKMSRRVLKPQPGKISIDGFEMELQAAERRRCEAEEEHKKQERLIKRMMNAQLREQEELWRRADPAIRGKKKDWLKRWIDSEEIIYFQPDHPDYERWHPAPQPLFEIDLSRGVEGIPAIPQGQQLVIDVSSDGLEDPQPVPISPCSPLVDTTYPVTPLQASDYAGFPGGQDEESDPEDELEEYNSSPPIYHNTSAQVAGVPATPSRLPQGPSTPVSPQRQGESGYQWMQRSLFSRLPPLAERLGRGI